VKAAKVLVILIVIIFSGCTEISFDKKLQYREAIDQIGRKVRVHENVDKIITAYSPAMSFIFQMGAYKKLISTNISERTFSAYTELYPLIRELPRFGSKMGVNLEGILRADPDLVILFPGATGRDVAKKLDRYGIPAFIIYPESSYHIDRTILSLGEILGKDKRAKKIIEYKKRVLSHLKFSAVMKRKKKIYYASPADLLTTYTSSMLQGDMIVRSGCINVAHDLPGSYVQVSVEQLIKWNPDLIILSSTSALSPSEVLKDKRLSEVSAVKKKKVFKMLSNIEPFDYPSAAHIPGIVWLAKKAYPEYLKKIDLSALVEEFYRLVYGRSFKELGGKFE